MVYPLDKYVDVLQKLDISPIQVLFLQIIYEKRHDLLYKIAMEGKPFPRPYLDDLVEKGLAIDTNPGGKDKYSDYYEVTDKFIQAFYAARTNAGEEFWAAYPAFITIDGKKIPVKATNKEELVRWYQKHVIVVHDHDRIMEALQYAKNNKLISMRIDNWLQSESYKDIWEMMKDAPVDDLPHDRIL